ncbi:hypothetical protein [Aliiroseovarius sp. xm-a-151]|nr:hypothetical protein [Aliiroseovarius sp. xm-a-151]
MMDKQSEANQSKVRFFLVDGSIPALESEPGVMLLMRTDGTWASIVPREVLGDEGSPEVSKEAFITAVLRLGGSIPRAS